MTRVSAPSRVHFGLLSLPTEGLDRWPGIDGEPGLPVRHFGGVGMLVDHPGLCVHVEPAADWSATGWLSDRALEFARRFVATLLPDERQPFRITVEYAPTAHRGLGVGTQLGLATARAVAVESGHPDWPAAELAVRVGRGERSAIGAHGFDGGGLIVEGGKLPGEPLSPLVARVPFPTDWRVLVYDAPGDAAWHGGRERHAFAQLASAAPPPSESAALCRVILTGLLPALVAHDLDGFGEALYEFNPRAGDAFAAAQGGRYAGPAVAELVTRLRRMGVRGVGQSSWGPTVFAVVGSPVEAVDLHRATARDVPAGIARASNGAVVDSSPATFP